MEYGKEQALRAKEAAAGKMRCQDYTSARNLILEALKTFPTLENSSEMLLVCDILCSAGIELPGCGVDWYWVLQLFPSAEVGAIEDEHRKLVSLLEPMKDDFPGTELALKFITDAFTVLSDPVKRAAFDSKRNGIRSIFDDSNSEIQCNGAENSYVIVERALAGSALDDTPSSSRPKRTAGGDCSAGGDGNSLAEVPADEKQKKKICIQEASWLMAQGRSEEAVACQKSGPSLTCGFWMAEATEESRSSSPQVRPKPEFHDFENNRKAELFSDGQVWVAYDEENMPRRYARIDRVIPDKFQLYISWYRPCPRSMNESKWCDADLPVACGNFALELNKITLSGRMTFSHLLTDSVQKQQLDVYPKKGDVWAIYRDWDIEWCSDTGMWKNCGFEMVEILTDYAKDLGVRVAYLVKVDGFKNVFQRYSKRGDELSFHIPFMKILMFSHNVPAFRFTGGEICGITNGMLELDPLAVPDNLVQDLSSAVLALVDSAPRVSEEANCSDEASSMNITDTSGPNPVIQNRKPKSKWSPKDFSPEQVWAVCDGPDAMPRLYVKVNNVISQTEVCVTFLEPHPMIDEEIQWVEESLPFVCGIFRAGRATANLEMSRFSHVVKCDRSTRKSFFRIFPQKGEVWAMFKNWNVNWKSSDLVGYQCRMVEILSDFSEETGTNVCSLIEVDGRFTFFQRHLHEGFQLTRQLSRLEMLSFSHRIPAFIVLGIKNRDIPNGSWHLEPDALPPKFIN